MSNRSKTCCNIPTLQILYELMTILTIHDMKFLFQTLCSHRKHTLLLEILPTPGLGSSTLWLNIYTTCKECDTELVSAASVKSRSPSGVQDQGAALCSYVVARREFLVSLLPSYLSHEKPPRYNSV